MSKEEIDKYIIDNPMIDELYESIKSAYSLERNDENFIHFCYLVNSRCHEHKERIQDIEKSICVIEQKDREIRELKKKLEEAQSNAVKFGFVKAISEFNKLISDINWADEKKIKVNIRKFINKQYEELAKDFRELQGETND